MNDDRIRQLHSQLDRLIGKRDNIQSQLGNVKNDIARLDENERHLGVIAELFRQLMDREVTIGIQAVERLLTEGLQAVFDDQDLRVNAKVSTSRGKVSVDLVTVQHHADGMVIEGSSNDSFGGSVATVQSILLRIIIGVRQGLRPLLLLDESLPAFDDNYVTNMGRFLSLLCSRIGIDTLLVTHNPEMVGCADNAYRIVTHNGAARFKRLRGEP